MKIIGGYDYYDGVGGFRSDDENLIFKRQKPYSYYTKDTHEWVKLSIPEPPVSMYYHFEESISKTEVIFCGTHYFGLCLYKSLPGRPLTSTYIWSFDHFQELISKKEITPIDRGYRYYPVERGKFIDTLKELFIPRKYSPEKEIIDNGVVIATRSSENSVEYRKDPKNFMWSKNPTGLSEMNFASVVPPWEAYQEIEMYLGTILVNDKTDMIKVSDETKLKKYGFDKWSFKNKIHPAKPRGT